MIQFEWPWVFILLPLPLLIQLSEHVETQAIDIPPDLQLALKESGMQGNHGLSSRLFMLWLLWALTLLCLSQPWIPGDSAAQPVNGRAIALAVDVSASMERRDFELDGIQSDRLSVVKAVAHEFVINRSGDRLSLILYGKEAFIASPLTFDLNALSNILDSAGIGMAGRSTAIGDAIGLAIQTLRDDPASSKAIVLLSDGTNNAGSVEPESAAELAKSLGIRIHTIALGSEDTDITGYATAQSADLDEQTLQSISALADGQFFRARTRNDLQSIYDDIDKLEQVLVAAPPVIIHHDLRLWPSSLLLFLLLATALWQRNRRGQALP